MEWEEGTECHRAPTCIHRSNTRYPAGRANGLVRWIQARPFLERGAENRCEISNRQRAKKPNKSMNEREDFELDVTIGAAVDAADPDDNPVAALRRLLRLGMETIGVASTSVRASQPRSWRSRPPRNPRSKPGWRTPATLLSRRWSGGSIVKRFSATVQSRMNERDRSPPSPRPWESSCALLSVEPCTKPASTVNATL